MLTVLIAEDDLMVADMCEDTLVAHGYAVCGIARTVSHALAIGRQHKPDLAVLDLRLADGDLGTDIGHHLVESSTGILYVTGNSSLATMTTANGHACLSKPYRGNDLLESLRIVADIAAHRTPSLPFPPGFRLLARTEYKTAAAGHG